jgi:hypothetical protein
MRNRTFFPINTPPLRMIAIARINDSKQDNPQEFFFKILTVEIVYLNSHMHFRKHIAAKRL